MTRIRRAGFTLIELMVAVGIAAALIALATPSMDRWSANQRAKSTIRSMSNVLSHARSEAIRTGNNHIVFFQTDAQGNPLLNADGDPVPVLIVDDGRPGAPLQNCQIDDGEAVGFVSAETGITWGVSKASGGVPTDFGSGSVASGASFTDPDDNPASWILFRSDGMPLSFSSGCAMGGMGSGAGGVYITNGLRDYALVVTPLGGIRVHAWDSGAAQWSE